VITSAQNKTMARVMSIQPPQPQPPHIEPSPPYIIGRPSPSATPNMEAHALFQHDFESHCLIGAMVLAPLTKGPRWQQPRR
jgi:hypothetical protein